MIPRACAALLFWLFAEAQAAADPDPAAIARAIERNDLSMFKVLVTRQEHTRIELEEGFELSFFVTSRRTDGFLEHLLNLGADANARCCGGPAGGSTLSLLGFVLMADDRRHLPVLLEHGEDLNLEAPVHSNDADSWPLETARRERRAAAIELLVKQGANIDRQSEFWGDSLLHFEAAERGRRTTIYKKLLALGVNPDLKNKDQLTAEELATLFSYCREERQLTLFKDLICDQPPKHLYRWYRAQLARAAKAPPAGGMDSALRQRWEGRHRVGPGF